LGCPTAIGRRHFAIQPLTSLHSLSSPSCLPMLSASGNPRLLAGLLRESVLFNYPLSLNGQPAQLLTLEEESRVSRTAKRRLHFGSTGFSVKPQQRMQARLRLKDAVVEFTAEVESVEEMSFAATPLDGFQLCALPQPTPADRGEEILSLFCRSGAVSLEYVASLRARRAEIVHALSAEGPSEHSMRFTDAGPNGRIYLHTSFFRVHPDLWLGCDLASTAADSPQGRRFMLEVFRTMRATAEQSGPQALLWFTYTVGHPYWRGIENYLLNGAGKPLLHGTSLWYYTRTLASKAPVEPLDLTLLDPADSAAGQALAAQLRAQGVGPEMRAMGVSEAGLTPSLAKGLFPAERRYFRFEYQGHPYFFAAALGPVGINVTRLTDSGWLVPLASQAPVTQALIERVAAAARAYFPRSEWAIPAVRSMVSSPTQLDAATAATPMRSLVFHPDGLRFYD